MDHIGGLFQCHIWASRRVKILLGVLYLENQILVTDLFQNSDGPNGCRGEAIHASTKAACFPSGACTGATFNMELLLETGVALAQGLKTKNVGVLLSPTINIHRHPFSNLLTSWGIKIDFCSGRNVKYYSEDPLLSGELAAAFVQGLQSEGVAATPEHLLVINARWIETNPISSQMRRYYWNSFFFRFRFASADLICGHLWQLTIRLFLEQLVDTAITQEGVGIYRHVDI